MTEQFIAQLAATALGGVIAAIAGIATIRIAKRLDRKDRQRSELIDAFATWAESFENLISITSNYCDLITTYQPASMPPDLKKMNDAEILRVGVEAGNAARRLEAARFRIALLGERKWAGDKVVELTKATKINMAGDKKSNAHAYMKKVPALRKNLDVFLARLVEKKHFD